MTDCVQPAKLVTEYVDCKIIRGMEMEEAKLIVLLIKPGEKPRTIQINHTLEAMQELVGGTIQHLYPFDDDVALICNDDGKLLGLPLNRSLTDENGVVYDIIAGDFFLCRAPVNSESFESLTHLQVMKYTSRFRYPEKFIGSDEGLFIVQVKPKDVGYER